AGRTYAGRTLLYEDCRRDASVGIGPGMLEALGPPLSLILASARWFSSASVARYREEFRDAYEKLARKNGTRAIDFVPYWYEIRPLLLGREKLSAMDSVVEDFHGRWSKIFRFSGDQRRAQYTTEELRPRVLSAFHTGGQLLSIARYHSPDVMVAASSVE